MSSASIREFETVFKQTDHARKRFKAMALDRVMSFEVSSAHPKPDSPYEGPKLVTIIDVFDRSAEDPQLFIDRKAIPRANWTFDYKDHLLTWTASDEVGQLTFMPTRQMAAGSYGPALDGNPILAAVTTAFSCDLAADAGVRLEESGNKVVGLAWDPNSSEWTNAAWVAQCLLMTYTVTPPSVWGPGGISFKFEDQQTRNGWTPLAGDYKPHLAIATGNHGQLVWNLDFLTALQAAPDDRSKLTGPHDTSIPSAFPTYLDAQEDGSVTQINGGIVAGGHGSDGTLLGLKGTRVPVEAAGYYAIEEPQAEPIAIFNGRCFFNDKPLQGMHFSGNTLVWRDLPPEVAQATGLGASGSAELSSRGCEVAIEGGKLKLVRLGHDALATMAQDLDHPGLSAFAAADGSPLGIDGLLAMSSYAQVDGAWQNTVQTDTMQDMKTIMNSFVPAEMWNLVFPSTKQKTLTGELANVAETPVTGYSVSGYYTQLATALLTSGISGGNDPNCAFLNGPRAKTYLNSSTASSKVYQAHTKILFNYHFVKQNENLQTYLQDQIDNAATYAPMIDQKAAEWKSQLTSATGDSDPDVIKKLTAEIDEMSAYAKTNNMFWAFAYFTYTTNAGVLGNIQWQISQASGNSDGSVLTRTMQTRIALLTAIDPTGYFAKKYVGTYQIFLATRVIPQLISYSGPANDYSLILQYLKEFVATALNSEDQAIQNVASQLQQILADEDKDHTIKASLEVLRSLSETTQDTMALPFIAEKFTAWFKGKFPKLSEAAPAFGGALMAGLSGLALFNIISTLKDWNRLSAEEKTQIIFNTVQFGIQIVATIIKTGIQMWGVFQAASWKTWEAWKAIGKTVLMEPDEVSTGLQGSGSAMARWLASSEAEVTDQEAGALKGFFGENMDEFVSTRLGFVFALAGVAFSLYALIEGPPDALSEAADIVNLVAGVLDVCATVGAWPIAEGTLFAAFAEIAGPLSILAVFVGVILTLVELFDPPPDPIATFVQTYATPSGYAVPARASAMDYASVAYPNPLANNVIVNGFHVLMAQGGFQGATAQSDGAISVSEIDKQYDTVWSSGTSANGVTRIWTLIDRGDGKGLVKVYLSAMADGQSVKFENALSDPNAGDSGGFETLSKVATQLWWVTPAANATLSSNNHLREMPITLQAVYAKPGTVPAQGDIRDYVNFSAGGATLSATPLGVYTLQMSGRAPARVVMKNIKLFAGITSIDTYKPFAGEVGSEPRSWKLSPETLPAPLAFDPETGVIKAQNQTPPSAPIAPRDYTITLINPLGSSGTTFTIEVDEKPLINV